MNELIQINTSTGTRDDAERIAVELVSRRLAACVQLVGPVRSHFRWKDDLQDEEEWLCTAKTSRACFVRIERLMAEIHPYDVPELIAVTLTAVSQSYGDWLRKQIDE